MLIGIAIALSFTEPVSGPTGFNEPDNFWEQGAGYAYGRGWVASSSGDGSVVLSESACESAYGWYWFEDANGDSDYIDEEDGICVRATSTPTTAPGYNSWNGEGDCTTRDNSYIASYTCAGVFPNGYVASYDGLGATCTQGSDASYTDGDCALCQADCYDGKKDLPNRGSYVVDAADPGANEGPLTTEVLKNWVGARLPTSQDFFGFCGSNGSGGSGDYKTACSSSLTAGNLGHQIGRTDECLALSDGSYEWLSERHNYFNARVAGYYACSNFSSNGVDSANRFRAVFRP